MFNKLSAEKVAPGTGQPSARIWLTVPELMPEWDDRASSACRAMFWAICMARSIDSEVAGGYGTMTVDWGSMPSIWEAAICCDGMEDKALSISASICEIRAWTRA